MRSIVKNNLTTPYVHTMDSSTPWNEYPRPHFKRDSFINLNGKWDFEITQGCERPEGFSKKILVPFPPESSLSGIEVALDKGDIMHYRTFFSTPTQKNKRVLLNFGAVDQTCDVFINGRSVFTHSGGYLPFSVDITNQLTEGENELYLAARDDLDLSLPYGKQRRKRGGMWYTPVSGIWQTVWIECVPEERIHSINITPSVHDVKIKIDTPVKHKRLTLNGTNQVFEFEENEITVVPSDIHLWTPEDPYLYYFTLEAGDDRIESYFALREITVKRHNGNDRLCLNGKPYLFNGLLDQGYYPDGLFLPATQEGYKEDILFAKSLGFNTLRKHIKIEPPVFYYLCDTLGMAVFQDMVNNSDYSFIRDTALPTVGLKRFPDKKLHKDPRSRAIFEEHMKDTVNHLYNFPSIVYYTIFNEGWGQFCADDEYEQLKGIDRTRIIDSTSGWFVQNLSDVDSRHVYFKKIKIDAPSDKPIVISEFGGYSLKIEGHTYGNKVYGYKTFDNEIDFENAVAKLYLEEVAPLIDYGISALIYTQLSDIEDEINGFITYDRKKIKVNPIRIKKVMDFLSEKI